MPCKIQIRQNIVFNVQQLSDKYLSGSLEEAKKGAIEINQLYNANVISFGMEGEDVIVPNIHIPEDVIKRYYDNELQLEEEDARILQNNEIERGGYTEEDNGEFYQTEDVPASKASTDTIAKVKEACAKMGISIQALSEYVKNNPSVNTKGINGLADLVKGIIALSEGREGVALTEEMVHIATSILEQISPKFVTEMISKIERFAIYKQVYEAYKGKYITKEGKPDIRRIKKEAVDKLIAELIINNNENTTEFPELMEEQNRSLIKRWWENILDWFRGQYKKTNIDIFNVAAERVMNDSLQFSSQEPQGENIMYQLSFDQIEKVSNMIVNKLSVKVSPFFKRDRSKVRDEYWYSNNGSIADTTAKDMLKNIIGNVFEWNYTDSIDEVYQQIKSILNQNLISKWEQALADIQEWTSYDKLDQIHANKRLLLDFSRRGMDKLSEYSFDDQIIIQEYLPSLFKENKYKTEKQGFYLANQRAQKKIAQQIIAESNFRKMFNIKKKALVAKYETLIHLAEVDNNYKERIETKIINEINRRVEFRNSEIAKNPNIPNVLKFRKLFHGASFMNEQFAMQRKLEDKETSDKIDSLFDDMNYYAETGETIAESTTVDMLKKIISHKSKYSELATQLLQFAKSHNINISLVHKGKELEGSAGKNVISIGHGINKAGEEYSFITDEGILIDYTSAAYKIDPERLLLHEIIHSLTSIYLNSEKFKNEQAGKENPITAYMEYVRKMTQEQRDIIRKGSFFFGDMDSPYGFANEDEFVAEALTNPFFMEMLKSIPAMETTKFNNLFEEILNWIAKIFNISIHNNAYDQLYDIIHGIMNIQSEFSFYAEIPSVGETEEMVSLQQEINPRKNEAVDRIYNIYKEMAARISDPVPEVRDSAGKLIDKRHYIFDTIKRVAKTVTEKTKESNKMPDRTPAQILEDNQKRDWGLLGGHAFIEKDMLVNLIDKDGYAREVFLDEKINNPLDEEITDKLKAFNRELIRSYPKGTRFLIELKVINTKVKGMLASTVDFKAIEPTPDGKDFRIDTLDWKFMNINKEHEEDVPWYKQKDWKPQMGEYTKMDREEYGVTSKQIRKARMIPFQMNYEYRTTKNKEKILYPVSIEIGKLDSLTETNLYLLPVPTDMESTGSEKIDALVSSLDVYYEKLAKMPVSPLEKDIKKGQLGELSKAIRHLRMKMDFEPLANVGVTFLKNAKKVLDTLSNVDYSTMSQTDINKKLAELLEFKKSAEKFASIDKTFLSYYPKSTLNEQGKKTLTTLRNIAGATETMLEDIIDLQREYAVQFALIEGLTKEENKNTILEPEKEIGGFYRMLSEASLLSSKIINIATNYILNKKGEANILIEKETKKFGTLLLALEDVAKAKGKSAFNLIAKIKDNELLLNEKVDKEFLNDLSKAQQDKNKAFLLENLNLEAYKKLAQEVITKQNEIIEDTHYSSDDRDNEERKIYEKEKIKNALSIESKAFNGYTNGTFNRLYRLTMKADEHLSESYKEMAKDKAVLDMWQFLTELNQKAIEMGYLSYGKSSFFALIEATMIQKLRATDNMLEEASDMFKDLYSVRINEEHTYSKLDKETGEIKRVIPKLFTRTDKAVNQLSQDLTMVGPLWIKSLYEYKASVDMELPLLNLLEVERNKDHIITEKGNIVFDESGKPRVGRGNSNAEILATQIDDIVYGLREDTSSLGNVVISQGANAVSKNEEVGETRAVNIRKGIENMNALTQSLAVGLRWMIAVPNYFGNQFQSFINNGKLYTYKEYLANHSKMITGIGLSTIQKGLIDLIVPLNGDPYMEARRKIAWKQGLTKWLGTWSMQEAMMSTNYLPERNLQFTNALSFIDNAMVIDGKIVNIRQHLSRQDESRYKKDENGKFIMSQEERKAYEKTFNERVKALKDSSSLDKIATIENDEVIIPGVSNKELAKFRTQIVEWGRNLNGQMSQENKAGYRRDILLKSFAMFRNWIIRQSAIRGHDITYNTEINDWEYGRTRAFMKAWIQACNWNILKMQDIMNGTDAGLAIMDEMLTRKKEEYYKKNGKVLEITNEEFYDMMRIALSNEMKELGTLLGLMTVMIGAKIAAPPPDEDILTRNKYKYFLKLMNKITDEVRFYYSPVSFLSMTRGSFLPALGLIGKAQKAITALGTETIGYVTDNEKLMKDTHTAKYFLDIIPVASQFQRDWLPLIDPEFAKEMGIVVTAQPRIQQ